MLISRRSFRHIGRFLLLTTAALLGTQSAQALIVGTYNVRYENGRDAKNGDAWEQRLPIVASLIRFHKFEILGVQEAGFKQLSQLMGLLPNHGHAGAGRDDGLEAGEYTAILYRKDIYTALDGGTFWMSETPDKPSRGWDAKLPRICTWVKLEHNVTKKPIFVFNTHLDHFGVAARENSARLIMDKVRALAGDEQVIVMGDFNFDQTSSNYVLMKDSNLLQDAYETAPERYALNGTHNGFEINGMTDSRIDHIFHTKNLKPTRYGILTDTYRTPVPPPVEVPVNPVVATVEASGSSAPIPVEIATNPVPTPAPVAPAPTPEDEKVKSYVARLPSDHYPVLVEFE